MPVCQYAPDAVAADFLHQHRQQQSSHHCQRLRSVTNSKFDSTMPLQQMANHMNVRTEVVDLSMLVAIDSEGCCVCCCC